MFFTYHSLYKTHIIMSAKLTHHGGQIIYVIYIKIFYGVTERERERERERESRPISDMRKEREIERERFGDEI
jgi:hypothetical protein